MKKILIMLLAGKETHEAMGRCSNALMVAKEFKESGHVVKLIFDGAGTEWIPELAKESNPMHGLFKSVEDAISGACDFCAGAFKVKEQIMKTNVSLLSENSGHPSIAKLAEEGFDIITF